MAEKVLVNTLKVQRARKDLTQEELAELVQVTRKTINTVENGIYIPSTYLALKGDLPISTLLYQARYVQPRS